METFKVFGKLKRKELSFGPNDVRGLNNREERMLQSALGSLEKERKKSLFHIENEVKGIKNDIKETTNVWNGDLDAKNNQYSANQRCRAQSELVQSRFMNSQNDTEQEKSDIQEVEVKVKLGKRTDCWVEYSTQKSKENTEEDCQSSLQSKDNDRSHSTQVPSYITRPRNISIGSFPVSLQRQAVEHKLRKPASHSDIYNAVRSPAMLRRQAYEHTSIAAQSPRILRRQREAKSASSENIRHPSPPFGEPFAIVSSPSIPHRKISANLGTCSRRIGVASSSESSPMLARRKPILCRVQSQPILLVDSPGLKHRTLERTVAVFPGRQEQVVSRKISCPQLSPRSQERDYISLGSAIGARTLSHLSMELPNVHDPHGGSSQDQPHEVPPRLSVSPVHSTWALSDRVLQNRVNAFLGSLQTPDEELERPK